MITAKSSFAVMVFVEDSIFSVQAGVVAEVLELRDFALEKWNFCGIPGCCYWWCHLYVCAAALGT